MIQASLLDPTDTIMSGADLSIDELYRYRLWRQFAPVGQTVAFIMLNPSTADALKDDATIRRCIGYARRWGYSRLEVGNLYGYRTVSPAALKSVGYLVGDDNDEHLRAIAGRAHRIVGAWGAHAQPERAQAVLRLLRALHGDAVFALGFNQDGSPVHPLRQPANARLVPMQEAA